MPDSIHPKALTRPGRARVLVAAVLLGAGLALAGCGGSSGTGVAHLSAGRGASSPSSVGEGHASESSSSTEQKMVAFARCMRANGVPTFPDPSGGGGRFELGAGVDPASPSFKAAQAKCRKLMPGGGIGSGPPPSPQTLARFLRIARCMRQHGIARFPDPATSVPSTLHPPAGGGTFVISDIEGVILVMGSIDERSPAFMQAAAACVFPLHNH